MQLVENWGNNMALTHGSEIPAAGESGNQFCPKLERNWTRYDAHDHTGTTKGSKLDPGKCFTKQSDTALIASWVLVANDIYSQVMTLPTGITFDGLSIMTTIAGDQYNMKISKIDSGSFTIFCNDNTVDVVIYYG